MRALKRPVRVTFHHMSREDSFQTTPNLRQDGRCAHGGVVGSQQQP
jgi:hypothetical protein